MSESNTTSKISKSEQTKKNILNAYLDLIPNKKWDKITVKEICAHSRITRGTFYQYYSDIYDLMEQTETELIDDLNRKYKEATKEKRPAYPLSLFEENFDYSPPQMMNAWFKFCIKHKKKMSVLLDPKNGDTYFVKKLKTILGQHINQMMNDDGFPADALRSHFTKLFIEMHFLAVRSWLDAKPDEFLSTSDIVNLLNTMRVGANYLQYRKSISPDFDIKMQIPEDADLQDKKSF